jgi:hypothetical protein
MRDVYSGATRKSTYATDDDTAATDRNRVALDKLKASKDRLAGNNRSLISGNIRLAQLRQEGVDGKSDGRKGVSGRDRRSFGLQYAETVASQYDTLYGMGKFRNAANVLESGREYLGQQVSPAFAKRTLPSPKLANDEADRRQSARGAKEWKANQQTVINNFNFGDVNVPNVAQAVEEGKRLARLRALSNAGASTAAPAYQNANQGLGLIR